jgi:hypothetical protein
MAQTDDQISGVANYLATSTDGTSFTDQSGYSNAVEPGSQSRQSGETYTFDGDGALITYGKREPVDLTVRVVYTEDAQSHWEAARTAFEAGTRWQVRWCPSGNTAGKFSFTSGADSKITEFNWPAPDAGSPDPILCEYVVRTAAITKAVVSS